VRNREDFRNTRDLWHLGSMRVVDLLPGQYHYALGDAAMPTLARETEDLHPEIVLCASADLLFRL